MTAQTVLQVASRGEVELTRGRGRGPERCTRGSDPGGPATTMTSSTTSADADTKPEVDTEKLPLVDPRHCSMAAGSGTVECRAGAARQCRSVAFGPITVKNVEMLRKLNLTIFPVRYNDTFYGDVLLTPSGYSKYAYWDGFIVGAICCRLEPEAQDPASQCTYIMTLGVLAPYRQCHIGGALLRSVIAQACRDGVHHIYLHVQTSNLIAIQFYSSFGFQITETIRNYYKRIHPPDCHVLLKPLADPSSS